MQYPAPRYGIAPPVAKSSSSKALIIFIIVIVVIIIIAAIAIGLGVGLGVGLSKSDDSSSSSSSSSYSILSAPTVTCTYGGSDTCGCSATSPTFASPRIYQGYNAVANSWPWMVALIVDSGSTDTFCGGFLISYQHVVTAAHCVEGTTASTITIYAGIQKLSSRSSGQSRVVANYTIHPSYSSSAYTSDIAVLTLVSPFTKTSTVGKCCLTSDTSLPSVDEHGVILGWGKTSSTSGVSDELNQAVVKVKTLSSCISSSTDSIRFCADYDGTDTCNGDSGGPFMTSVNNSWTCTGITSSGVKCGSNGLYTRVSAFRSFIYSVANV